MEEVKGLTMNLIFCNQILNAGSLSNIEELYSQIEVEQWKCTTNKKDEDSNINGQVNERMHLLLVDMFLTLSKVGSVPIPRIVNLSSTILETFLGKGMGEINIDALNMVGRK